jgi:uncharacterized membrane protein
MSTGRLEAFSDGVLAVIITIMVLEIKAPEGGGIDALRPLIPEVLSYVLSFGLIAVYWNNHHHLLRATRTISPGVMWANMHLLFWLSLVPVATNWIGNHAQRAWPAATLGLISLMAGAAYSILSRLIIAANPGTGIEEAIGTDTKGIASLVLYGAGVALAFVHPYLAYVCYTAVFVMWFIPDRRLAS